MEASPFLEETRRTEDETTIKSLGATGIDPNHMPEPAAADTEGCDPDAHFMGDEYAESFVS